MSLPFFKKTIKTPDIGRTWLNNSRMIWLGLICLCISIWLLVVRIFLMPWELHEMDGHWIKGTVMSFAVGASICFHYMRPALVLMETGFRVNKLIGEIEYPFSDLHHLQSVDGDSLCYVPDQSANYLNIHLTGLRGE